MGVSGRSGIGSGDDLPRLDTDRYAFKRKIGHGGQASVWLVHDGYLQLDVALKLLPRGERSEEEEHRFRDEAQRSIRISAPNVIRLYDYNPDVPYLVMEYCDGGDLTRRIMSRRPAQVRETLSIARQICEGLTALHEQARPIIHRDLKPGNVLLHGGVPKIVDFGLSKELAGASPLTRTRGMMGTISYASPEQLQDASKVDTRTDLWALGVILHEMLTWERPFERAGEDIVQVVLRIRTEPPFPAPFALPDPVASVLARALQKDPQARYRSAREMGEALDAALTAVPDGLVLPPPGRVDDLALAASEAAERLDQGDTRGASEVVRRLRSLEPEGSLARYWEIQVRAASRDSRGSGGPAEEDPRIGSIRSLIRGGQHREARRRLGQLLLDDPGNVGAEHLLSELTRDEAKLRADLDAAHREADQARSDGDLRRLVAIWERMVTRAAEHPEVRAELAVARRELAIQERPQALEAAARDASVLSSAGDEVGALHCWEAFLAVYPDDPEAVSQARGLRERLEARAHRQAAAPVELDVREQVERRVREATERRAREEAERRAREEEEAAQEESERKAREQAERKVTEERERRAREEGERRAREQAEHRAREEAVHQTRQVAAREPATPRPAKKELPPMPSRVGRAAWLAAAAVLILGVVVVWAYLSGGSEETRPSTQGPAKTSEQATRQEEVLAPGGESGPSGESSNGPGGDTPAEEAPAEQAGEKAPPVDLRRGRAEVAKLQSAMTSVFGASFADLRKKILDLEEQLDAWTQAQAKGNAVSPAEFDRFLKDAGRLQREIAAASSTPAPAEMRPAQAAATVAIAVESDADCVVSVAGQDLALTAGQRVTAVLPRGRQSFLARSRRYPDVTLKDSLDVAEGGAISIPLKRLEEDRVAADRVATDGMTFVEGGRRWLRPSRVTRDDVESAEEYCRSSAVGGFRDWRLPKTSELEEIEQKEGIFEKGITFNPKKIAGRMKAGRCRFPAEAARDGMDCTNARSSDGSLRFWTAAKREGQAVTYDFAGPFRQRLAKAEIKSAWYVICVRDHAARK